MSGKTLASRLTTPGRAASVLAAVAVVPGVSGPAGIVADRLNFVWFTDAQSNMMSMVGQAG